MISCQPLHFHISTYYCIVQCTSWRDWKHSYLILFRTNCSTFTNIFCSKHIGRLALWGDFILYSFMSFLLLDSLHTYIHVTYCSVLELCSIHVEEHDRALSAHWVQRAFVIRTIHHTHKCIIHHFSWGGMDAIAAATVASSASLQWIVIRCTVIAVHYWCSRDMLTFQDCRMVHYACSTSTHTV